jgi:hypothetical protein
MEMDRLDKLKLSESTFSPKDAPHLASLHKSQVQSAFHNAYSNSYCLLISSRWAIIVAMSVVET